MIEKNNRPLFQNDILSSREVRALGYCRSLRTGRNKTQCLASGWMHVLPVIALGISLRRAGVRIA